MIRSPKTFEEYQSNCVERGINFPHECESNLEAMINKDHRIRKIGSHYDKQLKKAKKKKPEEMAFIRNGILGDISEGGAIDGMVTTKYYTRDEIINELKKMKKRAIMTESNLLRIEYFRESYEYTSKDFMHKNLNDLIKLGINLSSENKNKDLTNDLKKNLYKHLYDSIISCREGFEEQITLMETSKKEIKQELKKLIRLKDPSRYDENIIENLIEEMMKFPSSVIPEDELPTSLPRDKEGIQVIEDFVYKLAKRVSLKKYKAKTLLDLLTKNKQEQKFYDEGIELKTKEEPEKKGIIKDVIKEAKVESLEDRFESLQSYFGLPKEIALNYAEMISIKDIVLTHTSLTNITDEATIRNLININPDILLYSSESKLTKYCTTIKTIGKKIKKDYQKRER